MYLMRRFEEEVFEFYKKGQMPGLAHLYIGEEAVATGACMAIGEGDYLASTHRGHGHLIARGADPCRMMAEIIGKATGYNRGKGGSMHIMDLEKGILGANGIVGGGIPIATGAAYACKLKGKGVALAFFGDSASNQGTFHESVNMAAAWNLPIVYIIENNLFGVTTRISRVTKQSELFRRAEAYGIDGVRVDGNDVFAVYDAVEKAVERARCGEGPSIIECMTFRHFGHHVGEPGIVDRSAQEVAQYKARDPLTVLRNKNILSAEMLEEIQRDVEAQMANVIEFALNSPYPDPGEAFTDLYAQ